MKAPSANITCLATLLVSVLGIAGCSEHAQEMEEKVTLMQRQLDDAQKQLQAANQALANRAPAETSSSPTGTSGLPSREAIEASYAASVSDFRKQLDTGLKEFRVASCTVHSVQMPTELFPFTSQLSFAFTSSNGTTFTTDIPVKADVNGKWVFPSVDEVIQRVGSAERMAAAGAPISDAPPNQTRPGACRSTPAALHESRWHCRDPMAGSHAPHRLRRGRVLLPRPSRRRNR